MLGVANQLVEGKKTAGYAAKYGGQTADKLLIVKGFSPDDENTGRVIYCWQQVVWKKLRRTDARQARQARQA